MSESARESAAVLDRPVDAQASDAETGAGYAPPMIEAELLVEEISIDGMCGVY